MALFRRRGKWPGQLLTGMKIEIPSRLKRGWLCACCARVFRVFGFPCSPLPIQKGKCKCKYSISSFQGRYVGRQLRNHSFNFTPKKTFYFYIVETISLYIIVLFQLVSQCVLGCTGGAIKTNGAFPKSDMWDHMWKVRNAKKSSSFHQHIPRSPHIEASQNIDSIILRSTQVLHSACAAHVGPGCALGFYYVFQKPGSTNMRMS